MGNADQFELDPTEAAQAAVEARELADRVSSEGDAVGWAALEAGLAKYEAETGFPADELLPAETARLAFAGLERGREYARKVLCNRNDESRVAVEAALTAGGPVLITTLFAVMSLPVIALPVVVSIAAVLMVRGVDGFCDSAREP